MAARACNVLANVPKIQTIQTPNGTQIPKQILNFETIMPRPLPIFIRNHDFMMPEPNNILKISCVENPPWFFLPALDHLLRWLKG